LQSHRPKQKRRNSKMKLFWKKCHKWGGIFFTVFILMFCCTGIILNHQKFFSGYEVSRGWMPQRYQYKYWNNGIIKGTLQLTDGRILAYGNAGIWLTDSCFSTLTSFNTGLAKGIENREISNLIQQSDGSIWCAALFDLYLLQNNGQWQKYPLPDHNEQLSDITQRGDTLIALSRSYIYQAVSPDYTFRQIQLPEPENYSREETLFRMVWLMHSGELFGITGKLIVDFLAIVLIILCFTGIIYWVLPPLIRRRKRKQINVKSHITLLRDSLKWHNRLGAYLIILTLLLSVTGMCLRAPLRTPLVKVKANPIPGSMLDSENAWHDKLRAIRWDDQLQTWLLGTSKGFYSIGSLDDIPHKMTHAPAASSMGINVFTPDPEYTNTWLIGSLSGFFRWNPESKVVTDYFTGKAVSGRSKPGSSTAVSGYSNHLQDSPIIFRRHDGATDATGTSQLPPMPDELKNQPMSLWNLCLELHVGRFFSSLLGDLTQWFVFVSGLILSLVLISGYIVYRKQYKRRSIKHTFKQLKE